jgi:hypothetical protein
MSAYIVLAPKDAAKKVAAASMPSKKLHNIDVKGIDVTKLGRLHAIVAEMEYEAVIDSYAVAAAGGEKGPRVVRLPDGLVKPISTFDVSAAKRAWTAWAKTDEMKRDKFTIASTRLVLREMCDMCRRAVDGDEALYLWTTP